VKEGTEIGKQAKQIMEKGGLVPDEIMVDIIKSRTSQDDCSQGFILDGFPRTVVQAEKLEEMAQGSGEKIDKVIYLEVDQKKLIERLTGRRVCSSCGAEYHLKFKVPQKDGLCDHDGEPLMHRSDDHKEKIINRLRNFEEQTSPLIDYYDKNALLLKVKAEGEIAEITERILKIF
ncbi:MAG: adenylate kinase, partial [SAR324 cluster bacterium]